MDYIQVTVGTTSQGIEPVCGRLYQLGVTGVEIEDEKEFEDFLENNQQYWDYVDESLRRKMSGETKVKVYISKDPALNETLFSIRESMDELKKLDTENAYGRLELSFADMREEDWANNWKQYFKTQPVGGKILIKPEWEPDPVETQGRLIFTVNPGMTFGTGSHDSTRLCIELMEKSVRPGDTVLDLGCGSGILFIIALLLGAKSAMAVDIDPNAVTVAASNARMNRISPDRYQVLAGNILDDSRLKDTIGYGQYDRVFANIVADVIIPLCPLVARQLKKGGTFITSGIIVERRDEVIAALKESGFAILKTLEKNGWVSIACEHA